MDSAGVRRIALVAERGSHICAELRSEFEVVTPQAAKDAEIDDIELIVVDAGLPDAYLILQLLKRRYSGVRALWVGRSWNPDEIKAAMEAGATDLAVDPVPGELLSRAKMAVYVRRCEHSDLLSLAYSDELTGLPNRRHLKGRLKAAIHAARTRGEPVSVLMLDIDGFKSLNDRFGHQVGDLALVEFAKVLKASSRSTDTIGRWGGEEFLSIVPGGLCAAEAQAERIRAAVAEFPFGAPDYDLRLTVSIGATEFDGADRPQDLIERVDHLLYQAKRQGRDRTVAAPRLLAERLG